jgi:hypothetical protein
MTGYPADLNAEPLGPTAFAQALAARNEAFRTRMVQDHGPLGLGAAPLPPEVAARVTGYTRELSVDDAMLEVAQEFAAGTLGLAAVDFERNGYTSTWKTEDADALHTSAELASAWDLVVDDPELAAQWQALERLPEGTSCRRVTELYRARGFAYPGRPGSAPPLLAQHDWVHVLAEFDTTVESELEVLAFIAWANDDLHAFSLLAMVVSLFETGYLQADAGLFQADAGHLERSGVVLRVADAVRRGALCAGSVDFLRTDWFEIADLTVEAARARLGALPKSASAAAAGSVGPWEAGGISPFQERAGQVFATAEGRDYDSFGAAVA